MAKAFKRRHLYCLLDWPAKPLGGNIFFKTKSSGQALRVSLVKPGAYLSESYIKSSYLKIGNFCRKVINRFQSNLWHEEEKMIHPIYRVQTFEIVSIYS